MSEILIVNPNTSTEVTANLDGQRSAACFNAVFDRGKALRSDIFLTAAR